MRKAVWILVLLAAASAPRAAAETAGTWERVMDRDVGEPGSAVQALVDLAGAHAARSDHEAAAWVLREALAARSSDPLSRPDAEPRLLVALAVQLADLGRVREAEHALETVTRMPRPSDMRGRDLHVAARMLFAALLTARGDTARAEAVLREAHALAAAAPTLAASARADVDAALAHLLVAREDYGGAQRFAQEALRALERSGAPPAEQARALVALAAVHAARGGIEEAVRLLRRAARAAEEAPASTQAMVAAHQGAVALALGRYGEAEERIERALELGEQAVGADHPVLAGLLRSLADAYRSRGRLAEARAVESRLARLRVEAWGRENLRAAR